MGEAHSVPDFWIRGTGDVTGCDYLVRLSSPCCIVRVAHPDSDCAVLLEKIVVVGEGGHEFAVAQCVDPEPDAVTHQAIL